MSAIESSPRSLLKRPSLPPTIVLAAIALLTTNYGRGILSAVDDVELASSLSVPSDLEISDNSQPDINSPHPHRRFHQVPTKTYQPKHGRKHRPSRPPAELQSAVLEAEALAEECRQLRIAVHGILEDVRILSRDSEQRLAALQRTNTVSKKPSTDSIPRRRELEMSPSSRNFSISPTPDNRANQEDIQAARTKRALLYGKNGL